MFVAQVVGKSMEPIIPDGAYCLFGSPVEGTRQGRTVVVLLRDTADPETVQRFTVKRYESEKAASEDGTWRHVNVLLKPVNLDFEPIVPTCEDEGSIKVVAEMLEILG
jgi:SOS-response transcriptional repressor LexA